MDAAIFYDPGRLERRRVRAHACVAIGPGSRNWQQWMEHPEWEAKRKPRQWREKPLTDEQRADAIEERKMQEDLDSLYRRSEAGIRWLSEHDPDGSFHLWYEARIVPGAPMPAQSDERQAAYREYHHARDLWERIEARIKSIEAKA